jgi:hypothetical protein
MLPCLPAVRQGFLPQPFSNIIVTRQFLPFYLDLAKNYSSAKQTATTHTADRSGQADDPQMNVFC